MKKALLKGILALGLVGAGLSFTNFGSQAGIPSEHSPMKTTAVELAGIPSEHSPMKTNVIELAGIPSEHSLKLYGIPSEH